VPVRRLRAEAAYERPVRECGEFAERRHAEQPQPLANAFVDLQQLERERRDERGRIAVADDAVAAPRGGTRDEGIGSARHPQRKRKLRQRAAHGRDPAGRIAADAVHLEEGPPEATILDQRRGGIERVEDGGPHLRVGGGVVEEGAGVVRDGLRLDEGHPGPHAERRRGQGAVDDAAALDPVGQDQRGFEPQAGAAAAGDGEPEGGDPDADDRHGIARIANIRSIRQAPQCETPCP